MKTCFFDHNATTPLSPAARDAWLEATESAWLNPSSPYRASAAVSVRVEAARDRIADHLGVAGDRLVFNSGASEGNNTVFAYWARALPADGKVAVSPTEHPSVLAAAEQYLGKRVVWLELEASGAVDLGYLERLLESDSQIAAVSVMAANNETGVLNDWERVAELCNRLHRVYHCDASQWVGKLPTDGLSGCDFVTICAHKFGGPRGVGLLIVPKERSDVALIYGGMQQAGQRAGTEDVAGILSMAAAMDSFLHGDCVARDLFLKRLSESIPAMELVGKGAERLWNTASVIMPDFESVRWIRGLEKRGFLVSAGSACSTGHEGPSHVLAAMGLSAEAMRRSVRISSGGHTSETDWLALADAFEAVYKDLRGGAAGASSQVISI